MRESKPFYPSLRELLGLVQFQGVTQVELEFSAVSLNAIYVQTIHQRDVNIERTTARHMRGIAPISQPNVIKI